MYFNLLHEVNLQLTMLWQVPWPSVALQEPPMARMNQSLWIPAARVVEVERLRIVMANILNMLTPI
jgi:hypothetical protein